MAARIVNITFLVVVPEPHKILSSFFGQPLCGLKITARESLHSKILKTAMIDDHLGLTSVTEIGQHVTWRTGCFR
jgi:hypothetical protein